MKSTPECPAERAIYFLGGKWKIRIVFLLYQNKKNRFGEIKKWFKTITQQMLSKQLKELEIDGLINRKVYQVVPPKKKKNSRIISSKLNKNFEESRIR